MFTNWYYFQDGQNDMAGPKNSFPAALQRSLFSIGTVALGAFMISLASIVRLVVGWAT